MANTLLILATGTVRNRAVVGVLQPREFARKPLIFLDFAGLQSITVQSVKMGPFFS